MESYDFGGWATKNDVRCSDGLIIRKDAFKHCDGQKVPLVWNHKHDIPSDVLGHAMLENREEGVYAYCSFNDTESARNAKEQVIHGDITSLSIYANQVKKNKTGDVYHGAIREVSLVLAGANPEAYIDCVFAHSDDEEDGVAVIYFDEAIEIAHSEESKETPAEEVIEHAEEKPAEEKKMADKEKTVQDVIDSMNEEQQNVLYALVGAAAEGADKGEEGKEMKHNIFDGQEEYRGDVITHSDQMAIMENAKKSNCGSFKAALQDYAEEHFEHGMDDIEALFPEYELMKKGAPEKLTYDETWVDAVIAGVHKSPYARIRTRIADLRKDDIRAMGYTKTQEKKLIGDWSLLSRTTDPQTVYVKDKLERDDIVDITDFDIVEYQRGIMKQALHNELAQAILIGDGRQEGEEGKISESHIRSIWNDNELYTIHQDVDIEAAKKELQGTDTSVHFGDNYVYAEAIITAALYSREKYKGSGNLVFFCTPHLLNVMLLARDLNGRRIYESRSDLEAALNVRAIKTVEQFEGKKRKDSDNKVHELLGLFVNMADYTVGSVKGGQIVNFEDFDIDFNQYKYLTETRCSGSLYKPFSAIALEKPVVVTPSDPQS